MVIMATRTPINTMILLIICNVTASSVMKKIHKKGGEIPPKRLT
ncbi:hypothetical protein UUU_31170 [Klebsiella pneumoniae subsp. pneumoniae DSM 30104 = JCM 1662 = NBRC 14940]|nr:hypothetical protein UUU_31170 [Klebsiella pneumoniae subsp. pneumoniae DSM 30104 = JCM 1662 = NBRC 14940]